MSVPAASRRFHLPIAFGVAALYLGTFDSRIFAPDETQRFALASSIAQNGLRALAHSSGTSRYPPLLTLLIAGPVRLGRWFDHGQDGIWAHRFAAGVDLLVCVALVALFVRVSRALGLDRRRANWAGLVFGLTNPAWPYSKRLYSEPLSALLVLGAFAGLLLFFQTGRGSRLWMGLLCLVLLTQNNMVMPVAVSAGLFTFAVAQRRWRVAAAVCGTATLAAVLAVLSMWLRFGKLWDAGYGNEHFEFHLIEATYGLPFSSGKSILLFAPMTFLAVFGWRAVARRERAFSLGVAVAVVLGFFITASWGGWYGGMCWGPRFLLPIAPLASAGAVSLIATGVRRHAVGSALIAAFGLWVSFLGTSFPQDYDAFYWMNSNHGPERLEWFDPQHSPLLVVRHFRDHPWDISNGFLHVERPTISTIQVGEQPVKEVRIVQNGDSAFFFWSITDIYVVLRDHGGEKRVPAGAIGATLTVFNKNDGKLALDGNATTRWDSGEIRHDGMWVQLDFGTVRHDVIRLELDHGTYENDFPNSLDASIRVGAENWRKVPAVAAVPRLHWSRWIWMVLGLAVVLVTLSVTEATEKTAERPQLAQAA